MRSIGTSELIGYLNNIETLVLKSIYNHRCLTLRQIYRLHYLDRKESEDDVGLRIDKFVNLDILEEVEHFKGTHYFLTTKGVNIVRECFDLPTDYYDRRDRKTRRGYYRAGELKISHRYINHQHSLNEFIIGFKEYNHDIFWKYYDEKHISKFTDIRPDGLLNFMDIDFFIEIDMNTESKKQLEEKWLNYRRFLSSDEFIYKERDVVVLFVVDNTDNPQKRIDTVKYTLTKELLSKIGNNFEVYIDTPKNLLELLAEKIDVFKGRKKDPNMEVFKAFAKHSFSVAYGNQLKRYLGGHSFDFYARKIDNNNNIVIEEGETQEYLVEYYYKEPVSILKNISFLNNINGFFYSYFKRELKYIVVVENIDSFVKDLDIANLLGRDKLFITTINDLKNNNDFSNALYQVDRNSNVYKLNGFNIRNREFYKKIIL